MTFPDQKPGTPAIEVQGASKVYGEGRLAFHALKDVSLRAERGDFSIISGPSGSGKTTLLSILGCVLSPTAGSVRLFGHEVAQASERELPELRLALIGFVFQSFNLLASLPAVENVELVLRLRGVRSSAARRQALALLERVGLGDKAAAMPNELSGGQRQRVAIARAVAGEPPLLFADEPTASLDARSGQDVMALLRDLTREQGATVVVVSHDERVFHFASQRIHMEDGRICDPQHSEVAE